MQSISRRGFVISAAAAGAAFGLDGPLGVLHAGVRAEGRPRTSSNSRSATSRSSRCTTASGRRRTTRSSSRTQRSTRPRPRSRPAASPTRTCRSPSRSRRSGPRASSCCSTPAPARSWRRRPATSPRTTCGRKPASTRPRSTPSSSPTSTRDHISGLMAKDTNAPIFPNAEIYVPAAEYKFWTDPTTTAGAAKRIQAVFPTWKNIKQFEGDKEVVPGVKPIDTSGHTPGHTSYQIGSGNRQLIVLGDVTNIPALFVKNPGWHAVFDCRRRPRPRRTGARSSIAPSPTRRRSPATTTACPAPARSRRTARATPSCPSKRDAAVPARDDAWTAPCATQARRAPRRACGAFSLPAGGDGQAAGGGRASRRGWRARSASPGPPRFARHAAAALLQRVGVRPALADHARRCARLRRAASRAWPRGLRAPAAGRRRSRRAACSASSIARRAGPMLIVGTDVPGIRPRAYRRGVSPARPPRRRVRPGHGRRLLAGRPAAASARAASLWRTSAGPARMRLPIRWPISRAAPWRSWRR